ncbi:MAG: prephenate dehydratase [archaeon]|jgi:chorismate mutase/prephenate dehydratase
MNIGFLGPQTSFSNEAALEVFPKAKLIALNSIQAVFSSLMTGEVTEAIVPIENSSGGSVSTTLDELIEKEVYIIGEYFLHVKHNFLARRPIDKIKKIYSHPQAFSQCKNWIHVNALGKELIEVASTSNAAERASIETDAGAIASKLAAERFGLDILEEGINDESENITRFIIISRTRELPDDKEKTSLVFGVKDKPGALLDILSIFKKFSINMIKIESRPSQVKTWEYLFFVEIKGNTVQKNINEALKEIQTQAVDFKVFGSYSAIKN